MLISLQGISNHLYVFSLIFRDMPFSWGQMVALRAVSERFCALFGSKEGGFMQCAVLHAVAMRLAVSRLFVSAFAAPWSARSSAKPWQRACWHVVGGDAPHAEEEETETSVGQSLAYSAFLVGYKTPHCVLPRRRSQPQERPEMLENQCVLRKHASACAHSFLTTD